MLLYITDAILNVNPIIIIIAMGKLFVSQNLNTTMKVMHRMKYSISYIVKNKLYTINKLIITNCHISKYGISNYFCTIYPQGNFLLRH